MRFSSVLLRAAAFFVFLPGAGLCSSHAQTFPATTGTTADFSGDLAERAISALPSHHKKTDAPLMYARIREGVYSVDGMVGKVRLNYDVKAASYLYLFLPGVGTAVVSLAPAEDAIAVPAAYGDGQITLRAAGHTWNLTGVESLVNDRGKEPAAMYVRLDRESWKLARTPKVGFGSATLAPYEWPGVLPPAPASAETEAPSLPVPVSLLPRRGAAAAPAPQSTTEASR